MQIIHLITRNNRSMKYEYTLPYTVHSVHYTTLIKMATLCRVYWQNSAGGQRVLTTCLEVITVITTPQHSAQWIITRVRSYLPCDELAWIRVPTPSANLAPGRKKVAEKLSASIIHERLRSFGNIWFINANAMVRWASLQIPSDQKSKSRIFAGLSRNGGGALWKYSLSQNYPGAYGGLAM